MNTLSQFFNQVRTEMAKVVWPTAHEWLGSTLVSLIVIVAFSLYLGAVDWGLSKIAEQLYATFSG